MRIAITGAGGFLGRRLAAQLRTQGQEARPVARRGDFSELDGCDAVVHLAGEPVAQRWTGAAKERIRQSRVEGTRALVREFEKKERKPAVLVSGSAIGFYGERGDETLDESSAAGPGFLAEVCQAWEREALRAEELGVRVVLLRTGIVLGPEGGALARMLPPFRLGLGGPLASGQQWMSWIHERDWVDLAAWALASGVQGPLNAVAPQPVRNDEFTRQLAQALRRPAVFPVPAFALKLLFGEMASMLTGGQRVLPGAALQNGFHFSHPDLPTALADLLH